MNIGRTREIVIAASLALALLAAWWTPAVAQTPSAGFPNVVGALRTTPGCLGVETGQTSSGKQVIFAWFEDKKSLVGWYHSDTHQGAMKTVFPDRTFDRQPLPELPDDSGPILAIVSVKFDAAAEPDARPRRMSSIGIELYGPLPGGVAVGGRFAPAAIKVRGLREIEIGTVERQPR